MLHTVQCCCRILGYISKQFRNFVYFVHESHYKEQFMEIAPQMVKKQKLCTGVANTVRKNFLM